MEWRGNSLSPYFERMINMAWNKNNIRNPQLRKELDDVFSGTSEIGGLAFKEDAKAVPVPQASSAPVNAVAGSYKITALEFALFNNGDIVNIDEDHQFSKVASGAGENQFATIQELAALVDGLGDFDGESTDGNTTCTIKYSTKGVVGNDKEVHISIVSDTTADFNDGVTASNATIPEDDITELSAGDTVIFDGNTFTMVDSDAGDNEFEDQTGLIALLDVLDDWDASDNSGAIDITYKNNTDDKDGEHIVLNYFRATTGGVDGTVASKGQMFADSDYLYIAVDANTSADTNWHRVDLGSAY